MPWKKTTLQRQWHLDLCHSRRCGSFSLVFINLWSGFFMVFANYRRTPYIGLAIGNIHISIATPRLLQHMLPSDMGLGFWSLRAIFRLRLMEPPRFASQRALREVLNTMWTDQVLPQRKSLLEVCPNTEPMVILSNVGCPWRFDICSSWILANRPDGMARHVSGEYTLDSWNRIQRMTNLGDRK